jgi:hypothetical protein
MVSVLGHHKGIEIKEGDHQMTEGIQNKKGNKKHMQNFRRIS